MLRRYLTRWLVIPRRHRLPRARKDACYRPEDLHLLREQVFRLKNQELSNKKMNEFHFVRVGLTYHDK